MENKKGHLSLINLTPMLTWFLVGFVAQLVYPLTKLNTDNMSITTIQFGLAFSVILCLLSVSISFLWESKPNDSCVLQFLYSSSKQLFDLCLGVVGFSLAYFVLHKVWDIAAIILIISAFLTLLINHVFLIVFSLKDVGTLKMLGANKYSDDSFKIHKSIIAIISIVALCIMIFGALYWFLFK
ncbi:hypothetical protein ND925_05245 [Vibrio diabolicus]|uniref:hypothetical protein n=1 Tax=Vibrio TaxID=662 RepID=UPI0004A3A4D8|nr:MULTISPECIES: hypothetical protein [Vibrio]EGQ9118399.1 hypothetical protein [Vibrio parahaemolyticus]EHK9068685.1 hypothetical protein [Vibrio vulnificus]MCR9545928.1 hypothetical protein [Vibrio antiquarius]MCR9587557.1 hypothetical protein [Vibrio alginolyticus]MCS0382179.1 hypothetical protein [Vibrio diabolicus]